MNRGSGTVGLHDRKRRPAKPGRRCAQADHDAGRPPSLAHGHACSACDEDAAAQDDDDQRHQAEDEQQSAREAPVLASAAAAAETRPPSRDSDHAVVEVNALGRRARESRPSSSQRFACEPMPGANAVRPNWSPNSSARPSPTTASGVRSCVEANSHFGGSGFERSSVVKYRSSSATNVLVLPRSSGSARKARANAPSDASACLNPFARTRRRD